MKKTQSVLNLTIHIRAQMIKAHPLKPLSSVRRDFTQIGNENCRVGVAFDLVLHFKIFSRIETICRGQRVERYTEVS